MSEAWDRAHDSRNARYKHGKAARTWDAVAREQPARREICEILARQMAAYEAADAQAEHELTALASRDTRIEPCPHCAAPLAAALPAGPGRMSLRCPVCGKITREATKETR
jgi:hypothetical protein